MRAAGKTVGLSLLLAAPALPAWASASRTQTADDRAFAAYPAKPFHGRFVHPDATSDKDHRDSRIELIEGARRGADVAGHFRMVRFDCGMDCLILVTLDGFTGRTSIFPLGGEAYPDLVLHYRIDSRLVRAFWKPDVLDQRALCRHADFVLVGRRFRRLPGDGKRVICPSS